jgi:hypothetical protein
LIRKSFDERALYHLRLDTLEKRTGKGVRVPKDPVTVARRRTVEDQNHRWQRILVDGMLSGDTCPLEKVIDNRGPTARIPGNVAHHITENINEFGVQVADCPCSIRRSSIFGFNPVTLCPVHPSLLIICCNRPVAFKALTVNVQTGRRRAKRLRIVIQIHLASRRMETVVISNDGSIHVDEILLSIRG